MEFKITHKTTLYQIQEECKKNDACKECGFHRENGNGCLFGNAYPGEWDIQKPKTYKEDFLEKFPNAIIDAHGAPKVCRDFIYGYRYCINCCVVCWNEFMQEVKNEDL